MNPDGIDLAGRVALVTGAGRGLGWGVAQAFARAGAHVLITDVDEANIARSVADAEAEGAGGEARGRLLDAADEAAWRAAVDDATSRWSRLDAVVHCGVYMPIRPLAATDPDDWNRQLAVGLSGFYYAAHVGWEALRRDGGGHLIGVASGSSVRGYHFEVPYCAVKHGQEGFAKALAIETRGQGVAVNTVGPGAPVKPTRMTWEELAALPEEAKAGWADPRELGRAFVWLAAQPPARFSGLRLDAGPIVAALERGGKDFEPDPDAISMYPDDLRARRAWMESYPETDAGADA